MAWSSLSANQMVSFTDAQGGGFALQPGQSNVTSNQCMTKNDALNKYVLDSSAMASYANNQLVPKSAWVSAASYSFLFSSTSSSNAISACSLGMGQTLYSSSSSIDGGGTLYTDPALTTLFNGQDRYWHSGTNAFRINTIGIITLIQPC